ncbi:S1 family peptidase [Vibrio cincinnatiensis]|uniref:S1 family peptidase n=1 Tax=Vibrio cincinnatiensis TaxID=675 RepID=UPI001EDF693D|nr:trypsin-like serine protease [Vibrio cincinnatiensis]MCG3736373.1 trypsin-like serine protease [Vibrio cincinnatiensis]MCG3747248.1 trypsin-like serine protease [Vibrio cincinnatiensis]
MNKWILSTLLSVSFLPSYASAEWAISPYIVNGTSTTLTQYPSFVSLFYDRIEYDGVYGVGSFCGGTMLDESHVLTAAHCLFDGDGQLNTHILLFTSAAQTDDESAFPNGNIEIVRGAEFFHHPGYIDSSEMLWANDIAIIRLAHPMNILGEVKLPSNTDYRLGTNGFDDDENSYVFKAVGHGNTQSGKDETDQLLFTTLSYVSNASCQQGITQPLNASHLCFSGEINSTTKLSNGTCQGDSGGPVYWNDDGDLKQVGITSFGPSVCGHGLGDSQITSVFTEVVQYQTWIKGVLEGAITADYIVTDEMRRAFFEPSSESSSSGGSLNFLSWLGLMCLGYWRCRKKGVATGCSKR